jgi:hypothetical protein
MAAQRMILSQPWVIEIVARIVGHSYLFHHTPRA